MAKFRKEELVRYSRQMILPEVGLKGQERLKEAKVLVVGAGGLGCPVLLYLNAAGVGTIGIIDFDKVELHNLHRQVLYSAEDIGRAKAEAAAQKLKEQNEHTRLIVYNEMLEERNAERIIGAFDVVVDGSDNFMTRYLVNDICAAGSIPLIYGSIFRSEGQLAVFHVEGGGNLRDIYPEPPPPEEVPNCDENGVLGMVPGIMGGFMALRTIETILGVLSVGKQLHLFDLRSGKQQVLSF